jgi:hypothetical protein
MCCRRHGHRHTLAPVAGDTGADDWSPQVAPDASGHGVVSATRRALDELIRSCGARPIAPIEDLDRFRADLWESDEELTAFWECVRRSRDSDD